MGDLAIEREERLNALCESFAQELLALGFSLREIEMRLLAVLSTAAVRANGTQIRAAAALGVHRNTLGRILKEDRELMLNRLRRVRKQV